MERTDFIERITDPKLLQNDNGEVWTALSSQYPYASLIQLFDFKKKSKVSQDDIARLQLHCENPLHFNHITKGHRPEVLAIVDVKEDMKDEMEALLSSKKADTVKAVDKIQTEEVVQPKKKIRFAQEKQKAEVIEQKEESLPAEKDNNWKEESATIVEDKTTKEDVLELINELPEENPIKKTSSEEEVTTTQESQEAKTQNEQDPQDLMVMMSFTDWLQYFKAKKENEEEDRKGKDAIRSAWQKEKLAEAMDDEEDVVPDDIFEKAMKSVSFGDGLVTEPLAELYVQQGKTDKAIELYKKLSLLNPEKRTYFASRIKELHL